MKALSFFKAGRRKTGCMHKSRLSRVWGITGWLGVDEPNGEASSGVWVAMVWCLKTTTSRIQTQSRFDHHQPNLGSSAIGSLGKKRHSNYQ